MDELEKRITGRMFNIETEHEKMDASIDELQKLRKDDHKILLQMHDDIKAVREIVTAWNNIKGFVQTVKAINSTIWFVAKIVAWLAVIAMALYLFGKTGKWVWPGDRT